MEKPVKVFKGGNIVVSLWSNRGINDDKEFEYKTISIQKSYKDKNGTWQHTSSFVASDLPKIRLLMDAAYRYLLMPETLD